MTETWPFYEETLDCVHCGLCLPACPTYDVLGLETDSPRGRVFLARALAEGRVEDGTALRPHFDQCLDCRACEGLCPSGVRYGEILEAARAEIAERWPERGLKARLRRLLLRQVVARQGRLRWFFRLGRFAELAGLRRLGEALGLVPGMTRELMPSIPRGAERRPLQASYPARGVERGRVAFFSGCIMEQAFGHLNRSTVALLQDNGFGVDIPAGQGCCGALLLHDGQQAEARALARRNVAALAAADHVINNSAGCGAALKEYGHLLGAEAAGGLPAKVQDISSFLAAVGLRETPAPLAKKAVYDDPCHLCHAQGVKDPPRELLARVPGLELLPHPSADRCCGSAGIYNINQPELAAEIGQQKAEALIATGAELVITGNPGCLMQIRMHLARLGRPDIEVRHPVELLRPASS